MFFGSHNLFNDGIHLVAQIIQRSPVGIFNKDQDIEVLRAGCFAIEDFVVQDDFLLLLFVVNWLYRFRNLLQVLISQTGLGLYHRQSPNRAFVVGCVTAFRACGVWLRETNDSERKK